LGAQTAAHAVHAADPEWMGPEGLAHGLAVAGGDPLEQRLLQQRPERVGVRHFLGAFAPVDAEQVHAGRGDR